MGSRKEYVYLLYNNKKKNKLLAMAYSEDEVLEETKYYIDGIWFQCEQTNGNQLFNEKLYRKKIIFPEVAETRISYRINKETYKWVN